MLGGGSGDRWNGSFWYPHEYAINALLVCNSIYYIFRWFTYKALG